MFIPLLQAVPTTFEIDRAVADATITVPLTVSEGGDVQVALEARLWRAHWHGVAVHEFKFAIVVLDERTGRVAEIFDRHEAASYILPVRRLIMPCVCAAAAAMIGDVLPKVIYRATYLTRPPAKSLSKHQMITDTLHSLGYRTLREGVDSNERRYWLMERSGEV